MDLMERVKAKCVGTECWKCELYKDKVCPNYNAPSLWDIEAIRKALGETSEEASDKEEIVVPKKITTGYATKANSEVNARMINEIIDCLEQIKERMK